MKQTPYLSYGPRSPYSSIKIQNKKINHESDVVVHTYNPIYSEAERIASLRPRKAKLASPYLKYKRNTKA
jgi:hypothetical protein